ncbi:hypothetical protein U6W33_12180, partial [Cutibacterium acnes]
WTVARQAPLFMGFSRPFPSPGDLSDPGIEPVFLASPALAGRFFTTEPPGKPISKLLLLLLRTQFLKVTKIFVEIDVFNVGNLQDIDESIIFLFFQVGTYRTQQLYVKSEGLLK